MFEVTATGASNATRSAFEPRRDDRAGKPIDHLVDLSLRVLVALARRSEIIHRDIDDDGQRLPHVIEHDDGIGEHHVEIGRAEVVVRARRDARLEASHDIVGEKAYRAAEEARKPWNLGRLEALHFLAQFLEGIGRDARFGPASGPDDIGAVAARANHHRGFRAEEGVAAPFFAAANAFEQE